MPTFSSRNWFELWYQPKIELRTMRLYGAEALVRARHPQRGVLPPGVFLPGAGEADMLALTERVIVTALKDWDDFAANGLSLKIAVNVPVSALVKLPIGAIVREERPKAESWPGLIMEVTEDEIIHDLKLANDAAEQLRAARCSLALDDFGAGYSSIARLKQLPFSELKIDRAYVINCHTDRVNAGLCEVFVELAKRFGLKTVAEGIELDAREPQAAGARMRRRAGLSLCQADAEGAAHRRHAPPAWSALSALAPGPDAERPADAADPRVRQRLKAPSRVHASHVSIPHL